MWKTVMAMVESDSEETASRDSTAIRDNVGVVGVLSMFLAANDVARCCSQFKTDGRGVEGGSVV